VGKAAAVCGVTPRHPIYSAHCHRRLLALRGGAITAARRGGLLHPPARGLRLWIRHCVPGTNGGKWKCPVNDGEKAPER